MPLFLKKARVSLFCVSLCLNPFQPPLSLKLICVLPINRRKTKSFYRLRRTGVQKIPLDKAKAGMKLAKPVLNENGRVLCGDGVELTDALLSKLEKMDVEKITVEGFPISMPGVERKSLKTQLEELDERFKKVESNPVFSGIKEIFKKQLIEKEEEMKSYLQSNKS